MKRFSVLTVLAACVVLGGCATPSRYSGPASIPTIQRNKDAGPFDQVWGALIPRLTERFFVINTIDRSSGLLSISYSGDPSKYVDCGLVGVDSTVMPAASARLVYGSDSPLGPPTRVTRLLTLDGRINLVVQRVDDKHSKASVNVRYVLTRDIEGRNALSGAFVGRFNHTMHFSSGELGSFPAAGNGPITSCVATGQLERDLLSLIE